MFVVPLFNRNTSHLCLLQCAISFLSRAWLTGSSSEFSGWGMGWWVREDVWNPWRPMGDIRMASLITFLPCFILFYSIFKTGYLAEPETRCWTSLPEICPSLSFWSQHWGCKCALPCPSAHAGAGDPNPGPHPCTTSTLHSLSHITLSAFFSHVGLGKKLRSRLQTEILDHMRHRCVSSSLWCVGSSPVFIFARYLYYWNNRNQTKQPPLPTWQRTAAGF